ncbi:putative phage abortive infection protein [Pedobacter jamesrossensis]|uniref:Phage abortive infection protein n=1 Tax=Pedobacter jamesrossensis TaxID=1908238 RepID=A0ABV8NKG6_9SPHI
MSEKVKKINYKRLRNRSVFLNVLYRILLYGTLGVFSAFMLPYLFFHFKEQSTLSANLEREYNRYAENSRIKKVDPYSNKPLLSTNFITISNSLTSSINSKATMITTSLSVLLVVITILFNIKSARKNGFKSTFFEFLKIHRNNVDQIQTKGKTGHDAFIAMYEELMEVIPLVQSANLAIGPKQVYEIAYLSFFWGVGPSSSAILKDYLANRYNFTEEALDYFITYLQNCKVERDEQIGKQKNGNLSEKNVVCLLDGHQSDLGHYFRHLYQTVTFIHTQPYMPYFEKYEYGKTLRAQFSNHELAIFTYNANSPLGKNWEPMSGSKTRKLISYYELIKNVPPSLVRHLNVRQTFPSITFEVDEH